MLDRLDRLRPPPLLPTWLGLFAAIAAYLLYVGPFLVPDTPAYSFWADRLIATGFDYPALVRENGSAASLAYSLFVTLVAVLKLVFGSGWTWALVMLGAASIAAVGALLARLAFRLTGSAAAAWAALILFAASFDIMQWAECVVSDPTFLLFAYAVFLMEAGRILRGGRSWLPVFAASAAASLYRPTGILLFPITAWSFYLARTAGEARARARVLGLAFLAACAGAASLAFVWQDASRWPFGFARLEIAAISRTYGQGQVVWDRHGTYHAPPGGIADYWAITADRFMHFFAPGAAEYSLSHWAVQLLFYVPVYAFGGWFVLLLLRGRTGLGRKESDAFFAALGAVLAYAMFHGVVQVDFDWRYRLPIMPHLILLAAGGVAAALRRTPTSD